MLTEQDVINWMGLTQDVEALASIVPAVNRLVEDLANIDREEDGTWSGTTRLGATLLAARLYKRKDTASGMTGGVDGALYVARFDSDIDRLLHLGAFRKPIIG